MFNAPAYFRVFWNGISRFIDPKTASKVFLLSGDISSGSPNDEVISENGSGGGYQAAEFENDFEV